MIGDDLARVELEVGAVEGHDVPGLDQARLEDRLRLAHVRLRWVSWSTGHRQDDEDAGDEAHLVVDLDADQRQPVAEDSDHDRADQRPDHTPPPAEEARPPSTTAVIASKVLRCLQRSDRGVGAGDEEHRRDP